MNPYQTLANAIVIQAAKDYREALTKLKKYPNNTEALTVKDDCERFFRSSWYEALTEVDGSFLMKKLRAEVGV